MGCDCKMLLEVYDKGFCKWYGQEVIDVGRDYELFGLLAGIRGIEFDPINDPRGAPTDESADSELYFADGGWHTRSFLYADEILSRTNRKEKSQLKRILAVLRKYKGQSPARMRVVFGFDS